MANRIICIGRQFGSGGHEIAVKTANQLGIKVYERELIRLACEYGELSEKAMSAADEKATNPYLFQTVHEGNYHVLRGRRRRDQFFSQEVVEENRVGTGEVATTGDRAESRVARRDEPHGLHERPAHRLEARVARAEDDGEIPLRLGRRQLGKRNRNERHALRAVGVEAVQSRQRHQHRVERSRNELAEARVDCAANRAQRRLGERRRRVGAPPLA